MEGIIKDPYGKTRAGITVSGEIVREQFYGSCYLFLKNHFGMGGEFNLASDHYLSSLYNHVPL